MNRIKVFGVLIFLLFFSAEAKATNYFLEKNWFNLGAGMTFGGKFFAVGGANVAISDPWSLGANVEYRNIKRGNYLAVQPSFAYSFASKLENPSAVNPFVQGGLRLRYSSHKGEDDVKYTSTDFKLLLGAGAELFLGPKVLFKPYAQIFIWDHSYAVIGFDGNYLLSDAVAVGIGFNFSDLMLNSGKIQGMATVAF
ncbi:MAG: hypothetical protein GX801_02720 [Fibrobacter sp.]|nr:hypothetical protein [Fibrobacter sp.]